MSSHYSQGRGEYRGSGRGGGYRGGFRGGRGGSGAQPFASSAVLSQLPPELDLLQGLKPSSLRTLNKPPIVSNEKEIKITDFELVGSYNWIEAPQSNPTIMVPGSPPEWRNRPMPFQLQGDSGLVYVDQNGFRMPSSRFLPLIKAMEVKAEEEGNLDFDWTDIDFVTDRNGLRKLIRWIEGVGPDTKEFRIDTQLVGKRTVLLNRWEKRTREASNSFTFGHTFEAGSTTPAEGCDKSTGHHRIVKYDMNGLKLVVRYEVDACLPSAKKSPSAPSTNVDELLASFGGLSLSKTSAPQPSPVQNPISTEFGLTILSGGTYVPHKATIELTTRTEKRAQDFNWNDAFPQLFLSQTAHHYLAIHNHGNFHTVQKRELGSPQFAAIAKDAQNSLKRLRRALDLIKRVVVEGGQRGRLSLVCQGGELKVYERSSNESCLPEEIMARFDI